MVSHNGHVSTEEVLYSTIIGPTHKRTEGRAPVWGSEITIKVSPKGGIQQISLLG